LLPREIDEAQRRLEELKGASGPEVTGEQDYLGKRVPYLKRKLEDLAGRSVWEFPFPQLLLGAGITAAVVFYGGIWLLFISLGRINRQFPILSKYPLESGLLDLSRETLEYLRYQTSLASSTEAKLGAWQLASTFKNSRTLETRPISLPGLTADCARYLQEVSRVFRGKAVICLDELDKLNNVDELEDLLRGIKGILGRRQTHFILTVSEDAVAQFIVRRRGERGMIESAFEDILNLSRIDFATATRIVYEMAGRSNNLRNGVIPSVNGALFWLFGAGIPREVKRNVLICEQTGLCSVSGPAADVWWALMVAQVKSLSDWTSLVGHDDPYSAALARWADDLGKMLGSSAINVSRGETARHWCGTAIEALFDRYPVLISHRSNDFSVPVGQQNDPLSRSFERASIETLVCLTGLVFGSLDNESLFTRSLSTLLTEIYDALPSNLSFVGRK
jgi:hypothetical protein